MQRVYFIPQPLDVNSYETVDVDDVRAFLASRFDRFPATARIYHEHLAVACDVTPSDEASIERLATLPGPFYVVVYPGEPLTIVLVVVAVLTVAAAFLLKPKVAIPNPALRSNSQSTSPNNELSARTNRPRVNGRIPDIFGTLRSTPDLLTSPYKVFIGHIEVEYAYMCIGRGSYTVADVRDDTTPVSSIAGMTVEIFAPNTSPNNSSSPQLRIGNPITQPLYHTSRANSVDGQVLRAPNANKVIGAGDIRFVYPDEIQLRPGSEKDFTAFFQPGDDIVVTDAIYGGTPVFNSRETYAKFDDVAETGTLRFTAYNPLTDGVTAGDEVSILNALYTLYDGGGVVLDTVDLSGTYIVASVDADEIVLDSPNAVNPQWAHLGTYNSGSLFEVGPRDITVYTGEVSDALFDLDATYEILAVENDVITLANPVAVNADWSVLDTLTDDASEYISPTLYVSGERWIGPFILNQLQTTKIITNFVAFNGLYKDDGQNQVKTNVTVQLEATPVDASGTPTGAAVTFDATVEGSAQTRDTRAVTLIADLPFTGRVKLRARRITDTDLNFAGSVVDEVKWRDLYAAYVAPEDHFGNVTTVHSVTIATSGALSIKDRKLNMLVTRNVPARVSGSTFTAELFPSNDAADILSFICLDPFIGNRSVSEVDFDNIYQTMDDIEAYFGIPEAREFSYTFDTELSFEEMITMVATAVFCEAYRRGNVIKLSFERATDDSTLLFNHRNKLPGSETRTVRFGNQKDNDGVEYQYVDPNDDSIVTFVLPEDGTPVNPEKVESVGIRTHEQAQLHAWRLWNKIRYQNIGVEFVATQEADLLVRQDRILNADNTRPDTQDGEIVGQNGLILGLSQAVELNDPDGHTIFLQHYDGTVQSAPVSAGADARHVVLGEPPVMPLALSEGLYALPTFVIVGNSESRATAFLVTEKELESNFTFKVTGVNYDARYYQNDQDFA